jgi:hypothetical protein
LSGNVYVGLSFPGADITSSTIRVSFPPEVTPTGVSLSFASNQVVSITNWVITPVAGGGSNVTINFKGEKNLDVYNNWATISCDSNYIYTAPGRGNFK